MVQTRSSVVSKKAFWYFFKFSNIKDLLEIVVFINTIGKFNKSWYYTKCNTSSMIKHQLLYIKASGDKAWKQRNLHRGWVLYISKS